MRTQLLILWIALAVSFSTNLYFNNQLSESHERFMELCNQTDRRNSLVSVKMSMDSVYYSNLENRYIKLLPQVYNIAYCEGGTTGRSTKNAMKFWDQLTVDSAKFFKEIFN